MKRSEHAVLTTHTGSLPRPEALLGLLAERERGPEQRAAFDGAAAEAVARAVARQAEVGLGVVSDGEQSKPSYATYVKDRLSGFDGSTQSKELVASDLADFPSYSPVRNTDTVARPTCTGPIAWRDWDAVTRDIANFKDALAQAHVEEAFMTAASPGVITRFLYNDYYPTHEAYLYALADVMKDEYEAIAAAGFIVQVDCPDLASGRNTVFADLTLDEFCGIVAQHLEALDHALARIPPERIRMHLCWGNREGPHHKDVPLAVIIDLVLRARPQGISFPAANPRHEHEWKVWEDVKLPDGKVLIPGVIDTTTNFIEHPELVAQRIERYAGVVGRENVIASTDCGLSTFAGGSRVNGDIAWAKLGALVEGARIASARR